MFHNMVFSQSLFRVTVTILAYHCTFCSKTLQLQIKSKFVTYPSSGSQLIYFSYKGPPSEENSSSQRSMTFLMSSLTRFWYCTWSLSSGTGTNVGPKQMARLYGSIMFSSLYSDKL